MLQNFYCYEKELKQGKPMVTMKLDKKTTAILSIVFGVLIYVQPQFLTLLVAVYLILSGLLYFVEK